MAPLNLYLVSNLGDKDMPINIVKNVTNRATMQYSW
jgi:hypothetical protein